MPGTGRKLAFVLASSNHGTMIVNRFDYRMIDSQRGYGVGFQILETAWFDPAEVKLAVDLLALRRKHHGDGVVAIDCGANIGVHTVEWATAMTGWGSVLAIEAQERIYYALAGNIAINNCFNAIAVHGAVSSESGALQIPSPTISFRRASAASNCANATATNSSASRSTTRIPSISGNWRSMSSTCRAST